MAEGKRPGGLTALAVLNFVFGGLGAIGVLAAWALIAVADRAIKAAEAAGGDVKYDGPGVGILYIFVLLSAISAALMITSGVGYIKQKKFLGRTLGNAYALLSIGSSVVGLVLVHSGFGIGTIIGLIYPVLTLFLLNNTFKDDLVN
jgi:small-conductance mechanosensitive channel